MIPLTIPLHRIKGISDCNYNKGDLDSEQVKKLMNSYSSGDYDKIPPITLRRIENDTGEEMYDVISGQHRYEAMKRLYSNSGNNKFSRINAIVLDISDNEAYELSLKENHHRVNTSSFYRNIKTALDMYRKGRDLGAIVSFLEISHNHQLVKPERLREYILMFVNLNVKIREDVFNTFGRKNGISKENCKKYLIKISRNMQEEVFEKYRREKDSPKKEEILEYYRKFYPQVATFECEETKIRPLKENKPVLKNKPEYIAPLSLEIRRDDENIILKYGDTLHIPLSLKHEIIKQLKTLPDAISN